MRCCAVSTRISPMMRTRSRMVKAMESRISARLPPTWCWMVMAVVISSRSSERTRRTMLVSACSKGRPRLTSRMTRLNSVEMGGCVSRTTSSMACRNEAPARRALATSVMVSARWSLKACRRLHLRRFTYQRGTHQPRMTATSRARGLSRPGRTVLPRMKATMGVPTTAAVRRARYSEGRSCRSARASSRAMLVPQSRRSTTRSTPAAARPPKSSCAATCAERTARCCGPGRQPG